MAGVLVCLGFGSAQAKPMATNGTDVAFPAQDGMTWVFLGDSHTSANRYTASMESYWQLHFPKWKMHFRNSGRGGEQLIQALDVFAPRVAIFRPTHVYFCYGPNGPPIIKEWGDQYVQLAKMIEEIGAKPILASQTAKYAAQENDVIVQRRKILMDTIAPTYGWTCVDGSSLLSPFYSKNIESKTPVDMQWGTRGGKVDLGHPGRMGYACLAYVALKQLGAPTNVSGAEIDASAGRVVTQADCRVSGLTKTATGISFTRLDDRLPMAFDDDVRLSVQLILEMANFNRYTLKVSGLAPGQYEVLIDRVSSAVVDAKTLADGWNMFLMPAGPIHDQLANVLRLIRAKEGLVPQYDDDAAWPEIGHDANTVKKVRDAAGWKFKDGVKGRPLVEAMRSSVDALVTRDESIHQAAQPKPRTFEIRLAK